MTDLGYTGVDVIKNTYDLQTCPEIVEHGCISGVANQHIYYNQTIEFFDKYEDEIIEYIADTLGSQFNEELWSKNPCNITGYKNDTVWTFVELVASVVVEEEEEEDSTEMD